jgi:hypothetical protein
MTKTKPKELPNVERLKMAAYKMNLSAAETRELASWAVSYLKEMERRLAHNFRPGQRVTWMSSRYGSRLSGIVVKVNQNTCSVNPEGGGRGWRVPISMLEVAG